MEKQTKGIFFFFFPQTRLSHIAEIPSVLARMLGFQNSKSLPLGQATHVCSTVIPFYNGFFL